MKLKQLLEKRSKLKEEARGLIDTDFKKAQEKYKELEDLNKEIEDLEEEERMRTAFKEEGDGEGKGEGEKRRKDPKAPGFDPEKGKNNDSVQMRGFKHYLETREILGDVKTDDGFVVIPEEIQVAAEKFMDKQFNISDYVNPKPVKNAAGSYPVVRLGQVEAMPTVEELAENPKLAVQPVGKVDYKIKTHRGHVRISRETIEDAGVDALSEMREWLARIIAATKNKVVFDVLNNGSDRENASGATTRVTLRAVPAVGIGGLKTVKNKELDASYTETQWYMNQEGYDALDQTVDKNGRYLLQDSIAAASGKTLFGRPVVVIPSKILPTPADGPMPMFYGDMNDAVTLFNRSEWLAQWTDYMHFGEGLMPALRQDARLNDEQALLKVNFTIPEPEPADPENPEGA